MRNYTFEKRGMLMFDQNSRLPLYIQLKQWIIQQIEDGMYQDQEKIPPEHSLSEMHNVSRPTVRQALAELVQEGYLVKKRGIGTYVSKPLITGDASVFKTFAEEMEHLGFKSKAKLISKKIRAASKELADTLLLEQGEDVFEIVRLRLANDKPLVIRTSIIPCKLYTSLLEEDLENEPLYSLLAQKGILPSRSKQTFQAVPATKEEASLLNISVGTPLMLWEGTVFAENHKPIEKAKIVYLGSQFRFNINQSRQHSMFGVSNGLS
jgi:GntR family transcriptional regulator